jgi:uncharacterized protein (TIGR03435 family)
MIWCVTVFSIGILVSTNWSSHVLVAQSLDKSRVETAAQLPKFDVASIKPLSPGATEFVNALLTYPGGRVMCKGCTLQYLMMEAFNVEAFQVIGIPHEIESNRFNIEAKPPVTSESIHSNPAYSKVPPNKEQRQMLQALLMDRFQLKWHRGSEEGKIYVLMVGDKGVKLKAPKDKNEYSWAGGIGGGAPDGDGLRGTNISMPQLAERLSGWLERPVYDLTKLQGSFDFECQVSDSDNNSNVDILSSVITSLKCVGLNLRKAEGPVESIVVDHIEKPSVN